MHDKYVQMPGGTGPAANGIPRCAGSGTGGGTPTPRPRGREGLRRIQQHNVIVGDHQTLYLTLPRPGPGIDERFTRVTWRATFRRDGDRWVGSADPKLESILAGSARGIGIDFEAADSRPADNSLTYRGRARWCAPFSVGYNKGIGFTGTGCSTIANVSIQAKLVDGRVEYSRDLQMVPWWSWIVDSAPDGLRWTT